jgi:hypothetical protein
MKLRDSENIKRSYADFYYTLAGGLVADNASWTAT